MHPLHVQALEAAKRFKQAEADLVELFQKIEEAKIFLELGYPSLFEYGVKALELSEQSTYAFILVARKSREVPELKKAIQSGSLSVSKARRIASVINMENQDIWLKAAQVLPKAQLEKEVARENPIMSVQESAKYIAADRLELKLGISEELMKELRRIQDLESQRTRTAVSLEDALKVMAKQYLEKNDPIRKAERARPQLCPGIVNRPGRSRIPNFTRHALNRRDKGQCTFVNADGSRCTRTRWIDIHHIKYVANGGTNALENLTTLCSYHHRFTHKK